MHSKLSLQCPDAGECTVCGRKRGLVVREVETDAGPACTTACGSCWARGEVPPISPMVAAFCVQAHRRHLGLEAVTP